MSWHFSRALAEAYLAATSSDGVPFAPSNGNPTPQLYLQPDRMTAFSRISRSGMTCAPLTADHSEALLTWYLAASRARTSLQQGGARASMARAQDYGARWPESSARYDPATSSWRTHRCLWDEALPWSSVTLPRWGLMRSGLVLRHPTLERPINGTASGLWQTPVADDAVNRSAGKWNSRGEPKLSAQVKLWPTPKANDAEKRGNFDVTNPRNGLPAAVKAWPTPTSSLGTKGGRVTPRKGREGGTLIEAIAARKWPTPQASDATKWSNQSLAERKEKGQQIRLPTMVSPDGGAGGQLNPDWVEWLMGWPIGWSDLKPLETARFREWQQQHSPCCMTFEEIAA